GRRLLERLAVEGWLDPVPRGALPWRTSAASLELLGAMRALRRDEIFYAFCRLHCEELLEPITEPPARLGRPLPAARLEGAVLAAVLDQVVLSADPFEASRLYEGMDQHALAVIEQTIQDVLCFIPGIGLGTRLGVVDCDRVARFGLPADLARQLSAYES